MTRRGTFTWNLAAFAPVDATGEQYAQGFFGAAYTQGVSDDVQLFVAGEGRAPSAGSGGGSNATLGAGLFWYLSQRVVLFGAFNKGLTDQSNFTDVNFGLTFAF